MGVFLIVVCIGGALFALLGYIANSKFQDNGGYMYLGGINGGRANKYLKSNNKANEIYNQLTKHGHTPWQDNDINKLIQSGAGAVFTSKDSSDIIVVTEGTIIAYGNTGSPSAGTDGQIYCGEKGLDLFDRSLLKRHVSKNIIGSYYMFSYHLANNCFIIDKMYFSNHIIKSKSDYNYYKKYLSEAVRIAFKNDSNS